jgi:hypothetical protein
MVMNDPSIHQMISFLAERKNEQEAHPDRPVRIVISRAFLARVKEAFRQRILRGELNLHLAAHLVASHFLGPEAELHSNVIGVLPGGEDRPFLIRERITRDILLTKTDLDLGNHLLAKFRYQGSNGWEPLALAANFVEYLPPADPLTGVNRITSRVKAEEELWTKVADELFSVDELIRRDKHLYQFSKYIKDVFGIKIVCSSEAACLSVHERLVTLTARECGWEALRASDAGRRLPAPSDLDRPLLEFVETKDYLMCDPGRRKKTGWKAIKSVVKWNNDLLEIQVQPLDNYYLELDHMSGPSHQSFRHLRENFRQEVASRIPLYGFYRDLLRCVFLDGDIPFSFENASVEFTE